MIILKIDYTSLHPRINCHFLFGWTLKTYIHDKISHVTKFELSFKSNSKANIMEICQRIISIAFPSRHGNMDTSCYCLKSYINKKKDIKIGQNNNLKMLKIGTRNVTLMENRFWCQRNKELNWCFLVPFATDDGTAVFPASGTKGYTAKVS